MLWWTLRQLKSRDIETRKNAARRLAKYADPRATEALAGLLKCEEAGLRLVAVETLSRLGAKAIDPLVSALTDPARNVRQRALRELETLDTGWVNRETARAAVPGLLRGLSRSENKVRKVETADVLGRIGGAMAVDGLADALGDPDVRTCRAIIRALARIGDPRAVAALVRCLAARSGDLASDATSALDKIDPEWRRSEAALAMVEQLMPQLSCDDAASRRATVNTLDALGWQPDTDEQRVLFALVTQNRAVLDPMGESAADSLMHIVETRQPALWTAALQMLDHMGKSWARTERGRALAPFLRAALRNRGHDVSVRRSAARALGEVRDEAAIESLIGVAMRTDDPVASDAADLLVEVGVPAIEALLRNLCTFKDAGEILARIGDPARGRLLAALAAAESVDTRAAAARALGIVGGTGTTKALVEALWDRHPEVRKAAAAALDSRDWVPTENRERVAHLVAQERWSELRRGDEEAVEELAAKWGDQDAERGYWVAGTLGRIGGKAAQAVLVSGLRDRRAGARIAAADALDKMGWAPGKPSDVLDYEIAREHWQEAVRFGSAAVDAIARALREHEGLMDRFAALQALGETGSARAIDPLLQYDFDHAGCVGVVEKALMAVLSDSTLTEGIVRLIRESLSCFHQEEYYSLKSSDEAVREICAIDSPVTSNILWLIARKKDIEWRYTVASGDAEYVIEKVASCEHQRKLAADELARRGNPPYRPEAYLK